MHDRLDPEASREEIKSSPNKPKVPVLGLPFLIFGVVLPLITLCFEWVTHWSAMDYFDPIPTWWHVTLVAMVPVVNGLVWYRTVRAIHIPDHWLAFFAGMSLVTAAAYSIAFLPMAPFGAVAILMAGLGLLPLTPMIAFFNGLRGVIFLSRTVAKDWIWRGVLAGALAIGAPFAWDFTTGQLLDRAIEGTAEERVSAIKALRNFGREGYLLDHCYRRRPFGGALFGPDRTTPQRIEAAREVYFRVTGHSFETRAAPAGVWSEGRGRWELSFDPALGGDRVANKVEGLTLKSSQFESRLDGVGLTSYTEWTAVFRNTSTVQREARAQIELPLGGVVSRVTLWIDGEPREAAFGGRAQVRAAYQEVAVEQRRDPILVTSLGADRVLMQCFPVPPNGKEMKVRLGVTSPLRLIDRKTVGVTLPRFVETNFEPGWGLSHGWAMKVDGQFDPKTTALSRSFNDRELPVAPEVYLELKVPASNSYADDPSDSQHVIRQTFRIDPQNAPKRVVYVIDGSRAMTPYRGRLAEIFHQEKIKPDAAWFAGDTLDAWDGTTSFGLWVAQRDYGGGKDNVPALEAALDFASQEPDSAIVWIHGPQSVELRSVDVLLDRLERAAHRPLIYDLAMEAAPNRIAEKLGDEVPWGRAAEHSAPIKSVTTTLEFVTGPSNTLTMLRERVPRSEVTGLMRKADGHLVRLWGRDEVKRLRKGSPEAAMKLAVQLQLVTLVSGAVVLERKEQYDRHGLEPAAAGTVPMIPEPGSLLLLGSAVACLAMRRRRRS